MGEVDMNDYLDLNEAIEDLNNQKTEEELFLEEFFATCKEYVKEGSVDSEEKMETMFVEYMEKYGNE
jgi:hypothetical protein